MSTPSILVSGASIAGPTVASWLAAAGWDVTVIERFDHLHEEGQNVDVRGIRREVLRAGPPHRLPRPRLPGDRSSPGRHLDRPPLPVFVGGRMPP